MRFPLFYKESEQSLLVCLGLYGVFSTLCTGKCLLRIELSIWWDSQKDPERPRVTPTPYESSGFPSPQSPQKVRRSSSGPCVMPLHPSRQFAQRVSGSAPASLERSTSSRVGMCGSFIGLELEVSFELIHHGVRNLFFRELLGGAKRSGNLLLMVSHLLSHFLRVQWASLSGGGMGRVAFAGK